jgi:hypothetical protein
MEVIYSAQRDGFEAGKVYRNPRYFEKADPRVTKAIVCGDWPNVAAAYRAAGAEVEVRHGPLKAGQVPPIPEELKSKFKIDAGVIVGGSITVNDDSKDAFETDVTTAKVEGVPAVGAEAAADGQDEAAAKKAARAEYLEAIGKPPGPKWDAAKIREEMAKRLAEGAQ